MSPRVPVLNLIQDDPGYFVQVEMSFITTANNHTVHNRYLCNS
jgi:hypothetical protein